jgi:RNA polymerase sigma-70 factor (ECF subfamily)
VTSGEAEGILPVPLEKAHGLDREEFEAAVRPMMASLLRTATAILGDESDARDALQDALINAWRHRASLRDPTRHEAWLARILLNECRMALRQRVRRRRRHDTLGLGATPEAVPDVGDFTRRLADRDAVERAFEGLGADSREVLVLYYLNDRSIADIATVLSVPEGTVKSRLFTARRSIAAVLGDES